jgi:hypothetical protein
MINFKAATAGLRGVDLTEVTMVIAMPISMAVLSLISIPMLAVEIDHVSEHHKQGTAPFSLSLAHIQWTLSSLIVASMVVAGVKYVRGWMRRIRDQEFMIGRRLHNVGEVE